MLPHMPAESGKFTQVSQRARDGATLLGSPGIFGLSSGVTASSPGFSQVARERLPLGYLASFRALLIKRYDIPLQRTATPWRILFLLLAGPVAAMAVAVGVQFAPNGAQLFHSTVAPGELPVVTTHLVHQAWIDRGPAMPDPIMSAVHELCLDDVTSAIAWVS